MKYELVGGLKKLKELMPGDTFRLTNGACVYLHSIIGEVSMNSGCVSHYDPEREVVPVRAVNARFVCNTN